MIAGLFGLGGPEIIALLVIAALVLVPLVVVLIVVFVVLPSGKKSKPFEEEDD